MDLRAFHITIIHFATFRFLLYVVLCLSNYEFIALDIWTIVILSALFYATYFADMIFRSDGFETTVLIPTTFYALKEINERNLFFPSWNYTCECEKNRSIVKEFPGNEAINMITTFHYMKLMELNRPTLLNLKMN
jgi:hypothetical protein